MPDLSTALVSYFGSLPAFTTLVPIANYAPVYKSQTIQLPTIIYQIISDTTQQTHDGYGGLATVRIQFTIWAASYTQAKQIRNMLRTVLLGFRGDMFGLHIGGIRTGGTDRDDWESETQVYQRIVDFIIDTGGA